MIVNPHKHQAMVLGASSSYKFSFPFKNSIDLLGVTIDKDLSFNSHISKICYEVNKQLTVLKRFKNTINRNVMLRLYKAFILPHPLRGGGYSLQWPIRGGLKRCLF